MNPPATLCERRVGQVLSILPSTNSHPLQNPPPWALRIPVGGAPERFAMPRIKHGGFIHRAASVISHALCSKTFPRRPKPLPWSVIKSACQSVSPKLRFLQPLSCEELILDLLARAKILDEATYKTHPSSTSIRGLHFVISSPEIPPKTLLSSVLRSAEMFCHSSLFRFPPCPSGLVCPRGATSKIIIGYTSICG